MRHWWPRLIYGLNQPTQKALIDKFGGLPWGMPQKRWPNCAECGRPMQFLAQLRHAPPMLDLGPSKVLHAFLCNFSSICASWSTDSGANAVFVLDEDDLQSGLTPYPADQISPAQIENQSTQFLELRLSGWTSFDDHLDVAQKPLFYDFDSYWNLDDRDAAPADFDAQKQNKAGPIPYWTGNGPSARLAKADIFLQLTGDNIPVQCDQAPPPPEMMEAVPGLTTVWNGHHLPVAIQGPDKTGTSYVEWANFCSDGTGFFFREETEDGQRYGLEILR